MHLPVSVRVALLWCIVSLASGIPRKSPYSSFISFPPLTRPQGGGGGFAFPLGPAASRGTESVVELPKPDGPGAEFTGHNPFDYGSSLNFGGPLSTGVAKLKVVNYEAHMSSDDPRKMRYGKPVVKAYESVYETKMKKNGQRYTSTKKRPLKAAQETRNEIEGDLDDLQDQMQKDTRQTFGNQPDFDFVLKPETVPEAAETPFPEAGDAGGFFF
ncbi:uncharacterized protein LOC115320875 [Ixodes scapularis]|uniref:uncharacterized protein LOC115320875 n=1 Tax=Ixodes scapularis TaxID=6945 RepID=UPI001A9F4E7A|nr:uncharacterized protein LOC115320875 [Ixodes scapularis]